MVSKKQTSLRTLLLLIALASVCLAIFGPYLRTQHSSLAGKVTVNGIPLDAAKIILISTKKLGKNEGITSDLNENGEFVFSRLLKPGNYIVRIKYLGSELPIEIPSRYNQTSSLLCSLKHGDNHCDFELYLPAVKQGRFSTEPSNPP